MAKFCQNCGSQIEENANFCDICGAKQDPSQITGQNQIQPPKKKTGLIIGLVVGGLFVVASIVTVIVITGSKKKPKGDSTLSKENVVTEKKTKTTKKDDKETPENETTKKGKKETPEDETTKKEKKETSENETTKKGKKETSEDETTKKGKKETSEKPDETEEVTTEKTTEVQTEPSIDLPYEKNLGTVAPTDFTWISDAMSGNLTGNFISNDQFVGKWKAEFIYDGIWELVYVTIDRDGTVTVDPFEINYGEGWEDESDGDSFRFRGSFDLNRVYGSGEYGKIDLYQFIESGGTQYGVGKMKVKNGNNAELYLVRP